MAAWYYVEHGAQRGPIDEGRLRQMIAAGAIRRDTLLWREGLANWQEARNFPELAFSQRPPYQQGAPPFAATAPQPGDWATNPFASPSGAGQGTGYDDRAIYQYTENGVRSLFLWYCICVGGGLGVTLIGLLSCFLFVPFFFLGFAAVITGVVFHYILLYRFWMLLQDGPARTTPGQAVGFLFIPFFNLYWMFVAFYGLAEDMVSYCRQRSLPCEANPGLALVTCILVLVPLVNIAGVVMQMVLFGQFTNTAVHILHYRHAAYRR